LSSFFRLGNLGFSWKNHLPDSFKDTIIYRAIIVSPDLYPLGLVSILDGLKGMKYEWDNYGKMETAIFEGFKKHYHPVKAASQTYDADHLVIWITSLPELKVADGEKIFLDKDVLDSMWNGIKRCSSTDAFSPAELKSLITG
jgi:hypothetical protein